MSTRKIYYSRYFETIYKLIGGNGMRLVYQEEVLNALDQHNNVACCCKYPPPAQM